MVTQFNCCDKQAIFNSDYKKDGELVVNRHCQSCKKHWHNSQEYTRQEWDIYLEEPNKKKYKLMKFWHEGYVMPQVKWVEIE